MRIFLSTCCLTAIFVGVTGFTNPTPTSITNKPIRTPGPNTQLAASYDYVNTRPFSGKSSSNKRPINRRRRKVNKDVVIVGGGLAGLSAALYLSQIDPNRQITILDRHDLFSKDGKTAVATFAAAGMLAPQSERLPKGDYLDLCLASKQMYPEFTDLVECMAQEAGDEGAPYLNHAEDNNMEPWNIGYVASGGFLAPAFAGDTVATWAPPEDGGNAMWLDSTQVRELEPNLHPDVVGGWWFPEDASVDARRLAASLRAACVGAGVQLMAGKNYEVSSLDLENGRCNGLWLKNGKYIQTNTCLVANGAWMRQLLPVPMEPHKGQSLSLRMPADQPPILRRVLFASDSYIVPKADGRIIIGATVEAGSYDPNVTPSGLMHILSYAMQLVPQLADLPLEETWAGLRPTTPDKGPILGKTPWEGLFLAGGYWRNGVLLAPKTGELLAMLMAGEELSQEDEHFLEAFAWDRFTSKEGGAKMAANARFAAAMYPVHSRKSGAGVAASVGTELGSYSTAVSAGEERKKDREALFGGNASLDALEKAAAAGKADASVFIFDKPPTTTEDSSSAKVQEQDTAEDEKEMAALDLSEVNEMTDSMTDTKAPSTPEEIEESSEDLQSIYQRIRDNKSKQTVERNEAPDERPDPGFRIFHIAEDGTHREVPPYTSPGEFLASIENETSAPAAESASTEESASPITASTGSATPPGGFLNSMEDASELDIYVEKVSKNEAPTTQEAPIEPKSEVTFDGYQTILDAAAKDTDIQKTMRENRLKNRMLDEETNSGYLAKIDQMMSGTPAPTTSSSNPSTAKEATSIDPSPSSTTTAPASGELSSVYQQIKDQKAAVEFEMNDPSGDERPDPGFRIFHIADDGTEREVPPYTSPGEFLASIEKEGANAASNNDESSPTASNESSQQEVNGKVSESSPIEAVSAASTTESNQSSLDGYEAIVSANGSSNREDELQAMREARLRNRLGTTD